MSTNTAYYAAEARLSAVLGGLSHDDLLAKLDSFIRNSSPDANRQLFDHFDVIEEIEEPEDVS